MNFGIFRPKQKLACNVQVEKTRIISPYGEELEGKLYTVTCGDCVHKFENDDAFQSFMAYYNKVCHKKDGILDIRDYETGLVL